MKSRKQTSKTTINQKSKQPIKPIFQASHQPPLERGWKHGPSPALPSGDTGGERRMTIADDNGDDDEDDDADMDDYAAADDEDDVE